MYTFINHNKHSIQISGPNKEVIRLSPGKTKLLPRYYLKYCPKYIKVVKKFTTKKAPSKRMAMRKNKPYAKLSRKPQRTQAKSMPATIIPEIIPNNSNIGIGILSCNRLHCVKRLLESIKKYSLDSINVIVSDESTSPEVKQYLRSVKWITLLDHKERKGVVHNTNALLEATSPYKYKLLLNDDVEVLNNGWELFYFEAMTNTNFHHFLYREISLYGANKKDESELKINKYTIKTIKSKPQGAVMAFDQQAFDMVGYYDSKFPKYGMAHVDWSNRISISGIQDSGFHDINGSENFFKIHTEKTVDENKSKNLASAKKIYDSVNKIVGRMRIENKSKNSGKKLVMWINTYNRVAPLKKVLNEIIKNKKDYNIKLLIFDDGSTDDYRSTINEATAHLDIRYEKLTQNNGKKEYWKLCNYAMSKIRSESADYYYWIPDDVGLCDNFFDVSIDMWENIKDKDKICLNLLMDRQGKANWTKKLPQQIQHGDHKLWKTHWIDCCGIMNKKFFESIEYNIPPIPSERWAGKPNRSSGVGEYISKLLDPNFSFYQSPKSLLIHGNYTSMMNSKERKVNTLKTENIHNGKMKDSVTFSMATMPSRVELLKKVVNSIYDQTDKINLYLNNFNSVPKFLLNDSKININMSQDHGDLGDAGKFFCCENVNGYHFTIDDDIIYPPNYAQTLINGIEKYNRKYLVGIHASTFNKKFVNYRKSRTQYHCKFALPIDTPVHMLGTGTLGYHTDTINLKRKIFEYPNMADTWLSKYCQENKIGCVALKRTEGWIKLLDVPLQDTIYGKGIGGSSKAWDIQNDVLKKIIFKIYGATK